MKTASTKTRLSLDECNMRITDEIDRVDAKVTFVMFKDEVIAFFRAYKYPGECKWEKVEPYLSGPTGHSYLVQDSYVHFGQHGGTDVDILRSCRRATEDEYRPLLQELTKIGYNVTPHQKGRLAFKDKRMTAAGLLEEIKALMTTANGLVEQGPVGSVSVVGAGFLKGVNRLFNRYRPKGEKPC